MAKLILTAVDSLKDTDIHLSRAVLHTESGVGLIPANNRLSDAAALKHELLTVNALSASDYRIIPVQAHFLASKGIPKVLETARVVQEKFNPNLKVAGILLALYQSRRQRGRHFSRVERTKNRGFSSASNR